MVLEKIRNQWAPFNGVDSYLQYADNDIFSFTDDVNDLSFVIEFDLYIFKDVSIQQQILVKGESTKYEWFCQIQTSKLLFTLSGPTGGIYIGVSTPITNNTLYKVKLIYDGSKLYYTIYDVNMGILMTNEPTGVACTFTPFATTTSALQFCTYLFSNHQIRNFKIFTDFAGTIPFMSLPLQDKDNLMVDRVNPTLIGTATDVKIITEY